MNNNVQGNQQVNATPVVKANGSPSEMDLLKLKIAELEARLSSKHHLACKIGEKGGVSVMGLGRFPVTLYRDQWESLIKFIPEVEKFIADHSTELSVKDAKK